MKKNNKHNKYNNGGIALTLILGLCLALSFSIPYMDMLVIAPLFYLLFMGNKTIGFGTVLICALIQDMYEGFFLLHAFVFLSLFASFYYQKFVHIEQNFGYSILAFCGFSTAIVILKALLMDIGFDHTIGWDVIFNILILPIMYMLIGTIMEKLKLVKG